MTLVSFCLSDLGSSKQSMLSFVGASYNWITPVRAVRLKIDVLKTKSMSEKAAFKTPSRISMRLCIQKYKWGTDNKIDDEVQY